MDISSQLFATKATHRQSVTTLDGVKALDVTPSPMLMKVSGRGPRANAVILSVVGSTVITNPTCKLRVSFK